MQTLLEEFCNVMTNKFLGREFTRKEVIQEVIKSTNNTSIDTLENFFTFTQKSGYIKKIQKHNPREKIAAKYMLTATVNYNTVSETRKKLQVACRRKMGVKPSRGIKEKVKRILVEENYDLSKRLPYGSAPKIAVRLDTTPKSVLSLIGTIRKNTGIKAPALNRNKPTSTKIPFIDYLLENNFDRKMPRQSRAAYDKIIYAILDFDKIPRGGAGLLIGTPEPFSATTHERYHNALLVDELEVGSYLNRTTDKDIPLTIVIGNLFHGGEQAKLKAKLWRNNNITSGSTILVEPVDRNSYTHHVDTLAQKHPLSKVILIGSGVWKCSESSRLKYGGHDFNFKDPSEYLTKIHRNLHILALTMERGSYDFDVRYLHDGKQEIL
ncbi:MAG: hypothetical protein PVG65_02695 [Candidatus Thorarchaeota archaeon]